MEESRLLRPFALYFTFITLSVLTTCESVDPGDNNGKEQLPTFTYPIVETAVSACYDNHQKITNPSPGDPFYGQDGNYTGYLAAYEDNGDGTTMNHNETVFGVNFVDGRIKGYPMNKPGSSTPNEMYFRLVRGNSSYGINDFADNGDGTVSDLATGLMWQQADDGIARNWEEALAYAESLEHAGYGDWRLPNAKELHSIVDYSRAPDVTGSPAIHPMFNCTEIEDPLGNTGQYPYCWTGTTHLDGPDSENAAVYIAFGEAQGWMHDQLLDVHGAGAQRSDPKSGNQADYPDYWGPQGDVRYVYNYVRCVRDMTVK